MKLSGPGEEYKGKFFHGNCLGQNSKYIRKLPLQACMEALYVMSPEKHHRKLFGQCLPHCCTPVDPSKSKAPKPRFGTNHNLPPPFKFREVVRRIAHFCM